MTHILMCIVVLYSTCIGACSFTILHGCVIVRTQEMCTLQSLLHCVEAPMIQLFMFDGHFFFQSFHPTVALKENTWLWFSQKALLIMYEPFLD